MDTHDWHFEELALVFRVVWLPEGYGGTVVVLKVEVDAERISVDDLVVDESLDEVGVRVSR